MGTPPFIELRARSAFSFLRGASQPEAMAMRAAALGHTAMALGDHGGVYGVPRFHQAAREVGLRPLVAADLQLEASPGGERLGEVRLLVESAQGWRNLCRLSTLAHAGRPKGEHLLPLPTLAAHGEGLLLLLGGCSSLEAAARVARTFGRDRCFAELTRHLDPTQERWNRGQLALAERWGLGVVATGDTRAATRDDRELLDLFTCLRERVTLDSAGRRLLRNAEQVLKRPEALAARFADQPRARATTLEVAARCEFTLESLPYRFPDFPVGPGESQQSRLSELTWACVRERYRERADSPRVVEQLTRELELIGRLGLAGYFLIVWDITRFCRERRILVQGRGSAANSAVCFVLGITAVDPIQEGLLFERFLSEERGSWPDIDLDLPSGDRREEAIQYVYGRYGPRGAAMCAEVITYQPRLAVREAGRALGIAPELVEKLARTEPSYGYREDDPTGIDERLAVAQLPKEGHRLRQLVALSDRMRHLPRHLSQHSGGMVIAAGALDEVVPLEPAAMAQRVTLQWDKDDCERLGLIKIDLLGLGMMAVLEQARDQLQARGIDCDYAQLRQDDAELFRMAAAADTVGIFQIESRAQMATLPRMKPTRFYDLVVSVALIRPGPIVGKMVNPYLQRRAGLEAVTYPHKSVEQILERTLGVPLFQEQLMRLAMVAGGLTPGEAQELRRAMSHKRSSEHMERLSTRLLQGMAQNGIGAEAAEQILRGITSFAEYGFPESHACSFALLVYASLWLKRYHPAVFLAALLDHQPMGFYAPSTLIHDAQRHGVRVRPACVVASGVRSQVLGDHELRLGLLAVDGLGTAVAERIVAAREARPFESVADCTVRARLDARRAARLSEAGAFATLGRTRRQALWETSSAAGAFGLAAPPQPGDSPLPELTALERTLADYASTGLTVGPHLLAHLRPQLAAMRVTPAAEVSKQKDGRWLRLAGLVLVRQRPETAKGMVFLTLEDETGLCNAVVDPTCFQANKALLLTARLLLLEGPLQNLQGVATVKGRRFAPLQPPSPTVFPAVRHFH